MIGSPSSQMKKVNVQSHDLWSQFRLYALNVYYMLVSLLAEQIFGPIAKDFGSGKPKIMTRLVAIRSYLV
eukprot:c45978_g1_i1 orf=2-208(-)